MGLAPFLEEEGVGVSEKVSKDIKTSRNSRGTVKQEFKPGEQD